MMEKEEKYRLLASQIAALIEGETDEVSVMANVAAAIHETMGFFWTGFYLVRQHAATGVQTPASELRHGPTQAPASELRLGPFQGPVACMHIAYGRGVCGTAWQRAETIVVPDVEEFPGHIACSSLSRSEIVVPVFSADGTVKAVLDIDSKELNTFDAVDQHWLEKIVAKL